MAAVTEDFSLDNILDKTRLELDCFMQVEALQEDDRDQLKPQKLLQRCHESFQALQMAIRAHAGTNENEILRRISDHMATCAVYARNVAQSKLG
jgi:hypothetical protein